MAEMKSVTLWMEALKDGDEEAARQLWQRYFDRLVRLAHQRLGSAPRRAADEEDVALSVFRCLCSGAARGKFDELADRDELWSLLVTMTARKVIDQQRAAAQQKRGGGKVRGESIFTGRSDAGLSAGIDQVIGQDPTPEFLALLADEHQQLMAALDDDTERQIAMWKMEGLTNEEIAERLGVTRRSVQRRPAADSPGMVRGNQ